MLWRTFLLAIVVGSARCETTLSVGDCPYLTTPDGPCLPAPTTPLAIENALPGSDDWWLPYPQWSANHEIEGIVDRLSYDVGDTVQVSVSSTVGPDVRWRLYRLGWYGGNGARLVADGNTIASPQKLPATSTWTVPAAAHWPVTFGIELSGLGSGDLRSGIYALRFDASGHTSYATFVVREDGRKSDIVFQRSDFTDAMYNNWDGDKERSSWYGDQPQWVSLDRVQRSSADLLYPWSAGFFTFEVSIVRFLEQQGYDVTYISNMDTHEDPHLELRAQVFMSAGHDEYWTQAMRDNVQNARDAGMHLAIFSSDTCDGILRFNPDDPTQISVTRPGDTLAHFARNTWGDLKLAPGKPPHDNPEDTLVGTHYGGWCGVFNNDCLNYDFDKLREPTRAVVSDATHPTLRNLGRGVRFNRFMGYEYEVQRSDYAPPNLKVVATVPSIVEFNSPPVIVAWETDAGTRVFNVGSMMFAHALDHWAGWSAFRKSGSGAPCQPYESDCFDIEDLAAQQLTINVLADMGARRHSPRGNFIDEIVCDWNDLTKLCTPH